MTIVTIYPRITNPRREPAWVLGYLALPTGPMPGMEEEVAKTIGLNVKAAWHGVPEYPSPHHANWVALAIIRRYPALQPYILDFNSFMMGGWMTP